MEHLLMFVVLLVIQIATLIVAGIALSKAETNEARIERVETHTDFSYNNSCNCDVCKRKRGCCV